MFYNLHTHTSTKNPEVVELINQYPNQITANTGYNSIGIHPWHSNTNLLVEELEIIEAKIQENSFIAVGECGLDKRIEIPLSLQKSVFIEQIKIAEKFQKPLILHCVAAYQEVIEIKKNLNIKVPIIIHGFSKNYQVAKSLIDQGFYLSFGKYLLRNPDLSTVFKQMPSNRIFLETDMIEESIELVYLKAQSVVDYDIKEVVANNFKYVFNM